MHASGHTPAALASADVTHEPVDDANNPFFAPSDLPYALPPFDCISHAHYRPAFERGMAAQRAEIDAIADADDPPTFANTIEALERSGQLLARVSAAFFNHSASDTNPSIDEIRAEIAPRLAAHQDAMFLNPRLYERIARLHAERDNLGLDAEQRWLLDRYHSDFIRAGAHLASAKQERLRTINEELPSLSARFSSNLLAATDQAAIVVDDATELDGLPEDAIAAAAQAAHERGLNDAYVLTLVLSTGQPALGSLTNRDLRRRLFEAAVTRAYGGEHDNRALALRILALRAERAQLLGYPHHAAYVISDNTASTVEAVDELMDQLTPAAVANARAEEQALTAYARQAGAEADFVLQPWDWAFYAERLRRDRFALDTAELREYLELERVLHDGVFYAASRLYGLSFTERDDLPVYHRDVRVFEVTENDGTPVGLFLVDPSEKVDRIHAARQFGQGFATTEYLAAVLLDLAWHKLSANQITAYAEDSDLDTVAGFEQKVLERHAIALNAVPPRYRTCYYAHIFAYDYAAAYYSYIWSEVLDADTVEWFTDNGGLVRQNGDRFRAEVLARGGSGDVLAAYTNFRGRAPCTEPLLQRRGLDGSGD